MNKIPVIYWSASGNTQMMAEAIAAAVNAEGKDAMLVRVDEISAQEAAQYPVMALGCPSMGVEVLEEYEFEPFFAELEGMLSGKKVILFGSYGWGGSYMQDWESRVKAAGAELLTDGILAMGTPDAAALESCGKAGKLLAQS